MGNTKVGVIDGHSDSLKSKGHLLHQGYTPSPAQSYAQDPATVCRVGEVTGKIQGVKPDILDYLGEVAKFFGVKIHVNSGVRTPAEQGDAMFGAWAKNLKRGTVYAQKSLPPEKRQRMDEYYKIALETPKATKEQKEAAVSNFKKEAGTVQSKHLIGDAVDLSGPQISEPMRFALELHLKHVKEGGDRCYHLQRKPGNGQIPKVDDALRARWQRNLDMYNSPILQPNFRPIHEPHPGHFTGIC